MPRPGEGYATALSGVSSTVRGALLLVGLAPALTIAIVLIATRPAEVTPGAYVALGDSFSSGVGAERYSSGSGICLRSPQSYVQRLGRTVSSFRACAGARTADVLRHQLRPFPTGTDLVTITIGGNDAGFADVLGACLLGAPATCDRRVDRAERFVRDELPGRLRRVYRAIRKRGPGATVVVAGYPRLFAGARWCSPTGRIDAGEQRRLNAGSDLLARTIAAEVGRHPGFRFADVREAFRGHGICSSAPQLHGVKRPAFASFHPNVAGYATYARVIRAAL